MMNRDFNRRDVLKTAALTGAGLGLAGRGLALPESTERKTKRVVFIAFAGGTSDPVAAIAPDFELQTPEGEQVSLSDYRGSPVALTFMHTD